MSSSWVYPRWKLTSMYFRVIAHIVIMICTLCFVAELGGYNPKKYIMQNQYINIFVILVIVASILYYIFNRNFYLPFLGWAVYPCGSLAEKVPLNADTSIAINVPPNVNVIYWASEPSSIDKQPIENPWDAYANYDNSGVVRADANGNANLRIRSPSSYKVGLLNTTLKTHVHYRICKHPGMLSEVKTVFI